MKYVIGAAILSALIPAHSLAADAANFETSVVEPAPLMPGSSLYDWNGIYAGVGGGYGAAIEGIGGEGLFGEAIVGYDYMFDNGFLVGIAATGRIGDIKASAVSDVNGVDSELIAKYGFDIYGRLGYTLTPETLGYALLGFTWQRFEVNALGGGANYNLGGVVLGLGTETALSGNWTLRHEYRYSQYASLDLIGIILGIDPSVHTFHTGLNYRFNGGPSSQTTAPIDYDWSGLKVGFAVGAGATIHEFSETFLLDGTYNGIGTDGFLGDVNIGYDHDLGNGFVVGAILAANLTNMGEDFEIVFGETVDLKSDYGFDVMLRVGKVIGSRTLAYVVGGYTWQHFELSASGTLDFTTDWGASGYTVGTGVEFALSERISGYSEYRYSSYSSEEWTVPVLVNTTTISDRPSSHTARFGLKMKLY